MTIATNRSTKAEKKKAKQRKTNGLEDVVIDEHDGIDDVHAQVELGLSELLKNLRSGSVKLSGDKATDIGGIIAQVIGALQPILIKAVTTMSEAYCSELTRKTTEATDELKRHVQVLTFRNDELEQYTRRENVKIHGLPETDNDDTIQQVVQLAQKAGVDIDANDISVAHRLPGNRHTNKPRTIIARFVRRVKRTDLMRKKANLRNVDGPRVFITDDLTKMRGRLLWELKQDGDIERAYSIDGKITCVKKMAGGEEKRFRVNSPDDL